MVDTSTIPDPTDYGNAPGAGPLRRGGQAPDGPLVTEDLPSVRSKASESQMPALKLVRDLWAGPERIRNEGTEYLPKNPGESAGNYAVRLKMTVLHNFYRRTVEGMVGLIFRRDPVLEDDVPKKIKEHWENIDNAGTHGDVFARELETDAMVAGHAAILVDFPDTGGEQDAGSEMVDIRPYWIPIYKDNMLSWRPVNVNGVTKLQQIVLLEKGMVPAGQFREVEQVRYRVLRLEDGEDGGRVTWELLEITDDKKLVRKGDGVYANQDEIPLSEIPTSGKRGMLESDPPLLDVAYLNIAHYQQWSDYVSAMHHTVPFLFTAGLSTVDENGVPIDGLEAAPGSWVAAMDPNATATYVAHTGQAIKDQKDALDALKSDIGALGLAMLQPQKRMAETAEAKRLDKATSDSALSVSARSLQDGLERALYFHARYLQEPSGGSVTVNRDFEGLLMEATVMQAFAHLYEAGFPVSIILEMLQRGGRIPEDADLEELEMKMLAAGMAANAEEQRIADAEADATQALREVDSEFANELDGAA